MISMTKKPKFKAVSTAQLEQIRKMTKDKGISRDAFQVGLDQGVLARALDEIKNLSIMSSGDFAPPPGGRIHILRVPVIQNRDWQEAINAAGSNTPGNYDVRKVGDLYPPVGSGREDEELILVNLGPNGGDWGRVLAWGKQHGLTKTNPRQVFAIGEHQTELHRTLGMDPMYVVATEDCSFDGRRQACSVWWGGTWREAHLHWLGGFARATGWFAFSRKVRTGV